MMLVIRWDGLMHNMGASYAIPVGFFAFVTFTQKYGTTPSIMDYALVLIMWRNRETKV